MAKKSTASVVLVLLVIAAVVWWFMRGDAKPAAAATERVAKELDVDVNVESPYFGLTDSEIAAEKAKANPAIDPDMRLAIDKSNRAIADDYFTTDPTDSEAP